jgi:acetylglutamate kinase
MKSKLRELLRSSPYLKSFYHKIIVIKCGGSVLLDNHLEAVLIEDIVWLKKVGFYPVLVHGGGKQISTSLKEKNVKSEFRDGLRVTTKEVLEVVKEVLLKVNQKIVSMMEKMDGKPKGTLGPEIIKAEKISSTLGFVGQVREIEKKVLKRWIEEENFIPVISCLGKDEKKVIYNINADEVAWAIASQMKGEKLIFITDVPGVMDGEGKLYSSLNLSEVNQLIKRKVITGGMLPKVLSCQKALKAGVRKTHIISGKQEHSLIFELLTEQGVGTEIVE